MNYHYVYRITNKIQNKHYYGVRSSKIEPKLDLGIKYFSSSSNKEFKLDQRENPSSYKYKIVRIFNTRKEAAEFEIKLHIKFNVGINESFYNKAIQTSVGFDVTGVSPSDETKQKMSEVKRGKARKPHSDETKHKMSESKKGENNPFYGKTHTEEIRQKLSETQKGENSHMFGKPKSEETKLKMSESTKGKPKSEETKQKLSEAWKTLPDIICPHCGKFSKNASVMKRHHFDNCKLLMVPENCSNQD